MSQVHPAENGGVSGITRNRWFMDDVTGIYHREDDLTRDYEGRLRLTDDIDAPGADELRAGFSWPIEGNYPEP